MSTVIRARAAHHAAARALQHGLTPAAHALLHAAARAAAAAYEAGHTVHTIHPSLRRGPPAMSRTPSNDNSSTTEQLLTDSATDYAEASTWREPAFQNLANTTKRDQDTEAREDRRAGR